MLPLSGMDPSFLVTLEAISFEGELYHLVSIDGPTLTIGLTEIFFFF